MKNVEMRINPLEQLVILEALRFAIKAGHFADLDPVKRKPTDRISLIAWRQLSTRTAARMEVNLGAEPIAELLTHGA